MQNEDRLGGHQIEPVLLAVSEEVDLGICLPLVELEAERELAIGLADLSQAGGFSLTRLKAGC